MPQCSFIDKMACSLLVLQTLSSTALTKNGMAISLFCGLHEGKTVAKVLASALDGWLTREMILWAFSKVNLC